MKKLSLNEGSFKDIEQTIINQDDPDYVEKDRERMFNSFVQSDKEKLTNKVIEWITEHICIVNQGRYLTPEDNGTYFNIFMDGPDPVIELGSPDHVNINSAAGDDVFSEVIEFAIANAEQTSIGFTHFRNGQRPFPSRVKGFNVCDTDGGIPFKISKVHGSLYVGYCEDLRSLKNFPNYVAEDLTVEYVDIETFEGWYTDQGNNYLTIGGNLIFCTMNSPSSDHPGNKFIGFPEQVKINGNFTAAKNYFSDFDGLSNNIEIGGQFDLSNNLICSLRNFPDSIKIGGNLVLSNNGLYNLNGLTAGVKTGGRIFVDNNYINYVFDAKTKGVFVKLSLDRLDNRLKEFIEPDLVQKIVFGTQKDLNEPKKAKDSVSENHSISEPVSILSLNEGLFKEVEKTVIDQDDPDYIEKDREKMFNQFKAADERNMRRAEIEKWIYSMVYYAKPHRSYYGELLKAEDENILWSIDSNFEIHLTPPLELRDSSPDERGTFYIDGKQDKFEIPYKISECSASLSTARTGAISGHKLISLKNFPEKLGGSLLLKSNALENLEGCPKIIHGHKFDVSENTLTSLKGGPKKVGSKMSLTGGASQVIYNVSFNNLTALEELPKYIYGSLIANNNMLKKLDIGSSYITGKIYLAHNYLRNVDGMTSYIGDYIDLTDNRLENLEGLRFATTEHSGLINKRIKVEAGNNYLWSWIHEQMIIAQDRGMQSGWLDFHIKNLWNDGGQVINDYTMIGKGYIAEKPEQYTAEMQPPRSNDRYFRFNYVDVHGISWREQNYFKDYQEELQER